jgi:hypothetical protein
MAGVPVAVAVLMAVLVPVSVLTNALRAVDADSADDGTAVMAALDVVATGVAVGVAVAAVATVGVVLVESVVPVVVLSAVLDSCDLYTKYPTTAKAPTHIRVV